MVKLSGTIDDLVKTVITYEVTYGHSIDFLVMNRETLERIRKCRTKRHYYFWRLGKDKDSLSTFVGIPISTATRDPDIEFCNDDAETLLTFTLTDK